MSKLKLSFFPPLMHLFLFIMLHSGIISSYLDFLALVKIFMKIPVCSVNVSDKGKVLETPISPSF
jgi:hypothetical protein